MLSRSLQRIRRFVDESVSELRKVSWPTLRQTGNLTVLVFTVSLGVGLYVLVFDRLFQAIIAFLSGAVG